MLNSPESNVKFTDEQIRQLEMFKWELNNLQAEVSIAQKHLSILKQENVKALELKKSLEPNIENLNQEIDALTSKKVEMKDEITKSAAKLSEHQNIHSELTKVHQTKQEELEVRESKIKEVELMQEEKQKELFVKNAELLTEREAIEKARIAFKVASESVVW